MFTLTTTRCHSPQARLYARPVDPTPEPEPIEPAPAPVAKAGKRCTVCGAAYKWTYCEACFNRFAKQDARIAKKFSKTKTREIF